MLCGEYDAADSLVSSGFLVKAAAGGRGWMCRACGKEDTKSKVARHIQTKHMSVAFSCPYCNHANRSEEARQDHVRKVHGLKLKCKEIRELEGHHDG